MKALLLVLTSFALVSCVTTRDLPWSPPAPLPGGAVRGELLEATDLVTKPAAEAGTLMGVLTTWTLGLQIQVDLLRAEGLDAWHDSRAGQLKAVRGLRLRFVAVTPQGEPDLQSGLLLLPATKDPLDWVIYDRGSELERSHVPSRLGNDENDLGWLLASLGHAVWLPDYGGVGDSPGQQHYCLPDSLAASSLDGLAAARAWVKQNTDLQESGRLRVVGYSEGGLAAMATLKAWSETPDATPGLTLTDTYALGAPLDLTLGVEQLATGNVKLTHPHYTVLLVLGWARAFPDQVLPDEILRPEVVRTIVPLLDGEHSRDQVHDAFTKLTGKTPGNVTSADVFRADYLAKASANPEALAYYRLQRDARLTTWVAPTSVRLTLAASATDALVSAENSRAFVATQRAADPQAKVRLMNLATGPHALAGIEALIFAIMDLDKKTAAL